MIRGNQARVLFGTALLTILLAAKIGSSAPAPLWPLTGVTLVSSTTTGELGDGASGSPAVSADGHQVAFQTKATNLVRDRAKAFQQIVVRDLTTGNIALVSADAHDRVGNGASADPSISDNGRFIAFSSAATNLAPKLSGHRTRIFVKDTKSGEISHISTKGHSGDANGSSSSPAISGNAAVVVFASQASNLTANCRGTGLKVFARNRRGGAVSCVSTTAGDAAADGQSDLPSVSKNGRYVAFQSSATNLDAACSGLQIYLKDRTNGAIRCVSTAADGGAANAPSSLGAISASGNFVAFQSSATNLDAACANGHSNVFVKNVNTGEIKCASRSSVGVVGSGESTAPAVSSDGTIVAFQSTANNLVTGDANAKADVFVKNLESGEIARVSAPQQGWLEANKLSRNAVLTADGHYVAFASDASNMVGNDGNKHTDVFVARNKTFRPQISKITRLSVTDAAAMIRGRKVPRPAPHVQGNGFSGEQGIVMSADTQSVTYSTTATTLLPDGCTTGFVSSDLASGDRLCATDTNQDLRASYRTSSDGRYVVFESTDTTLDRACFRTKNIFLTDNQTGTTVCLSVNAIGAHGNDDSFWPSISPDGSMVMFGSEATNLITGNADGTRTLYLKDLTTGAISLAVTGDAGKVVHLTFSQETYPRFSSDGGSIVYDAIACKPSSAFLDPLDGPCVKDLSTGTIKSIQIDRTPGYFYQLSPDWRYEVGIGCSRFSGEQRGGVAVYDLLNNTNQCASSDANGVEGNHPSSVALDAYDGVWVYANPVISNDGRYVVFKSSADNLVPNDGNLCDDVFVKDLITGAIARVSVNAQGQDGIDNSYSPSISADGRYVMFASYASNLVPGDSQYCGTANCPDVFLTPNPLFQ